MLFLLLVNLIINKMAFKNQYRRLNLKKAIYLLLITSIFSCNSEHLDNEAINELQSNPIEDEKLVIGERIDGPANIRNKPNGEILFELYDNALVEVSKKSENDWYQVLIYADIAFNEFGLDSLTKNRPIIVDNDTVGRVIKTHSISTGQGGDFSYAMLYGYTHKNNIRPETIIEPVLKEELLKNERNLNSWKSFIKSFDLKPNAIGYEKFQDFYKYDNTIDDPSPGFRIVLLFEKEQLVGLIHSRDFKIDKSITQKLDWGYFVTFFEDYPQEEQKKFIDYMNEWIQGVD